MADSMIERVARAIFKVDYPDDENVDDLFWDRKGHAYIEQARAAIEAMREPTEAMTAVGFGTGEFENDAAFAEPGMAARVFAAMIDASLQETK